MEVILQRGQTLWDLAVQHKGDWRAGIDMARAAGRSMTETPQEGASYPLPSAVYDKALERYAKLNKIEPATLEQLPRTALRVFSSPFSEVFA